ncbi:TonB-dependent receptor [Taibaiella helva]|uniref:TonB-dependent receptor n=1 Tax=Taibaiella helva TaxID=2301235 RepID=UPI000E59292B|nr:TonB-dependent receptor plug domain-containing protein [Taibaiella helva]
MTVKMYWLFLLLAAVAIPRDAQGQLANTRVTVHIGSGSLDQCLVQLEKATGFFFAYEVTGIRTAKPGVKEKNFRDELLADVLYYLLEGSGYTFSEKQGGIAIVPGRLPARPRQHLFTGVIEDKETGALLEGVSIVAESDPYSGTITDKNGYFKLPAQTDTLRVLLRYMSYKPANIILFADRSVKIKMDIDLEDMDSVLVVAPSDIRPYSALSPLSVYELSFLPRLMGNADLISMVKIIPGIQEANNGSGSVLVRGGAPDQNLIILDGMTLYDAMHLFGLMSFINPNMVKSIDIYKEAFPARYGGRLSSVWDISLKNGNTEKLHGNLCLGSLASDIMLEGPLFKHKTTFALSARRTYHDYFARLSTPGLTFHFLDLNVKLCHRFSDKNQVYFSAYASGDKFNLDNHDTLVTAQEVNYYSVGGKTYSISTEASSSFFNNSAFRSRNHAATVGWQHYSDRFKANVAFLYSGYKIDASDRNSGFFYANPSWDTSSRNNYSQTAQQDFAARSQARYRLDETHCLEGGFSYTRYHFSPYRYTQADSAIRSGVAFPSLLFQDFIAGQDANEVSFFLEDTKAFSSRLNISAGLFTSKYFHEKASYFSLQPRFSFRYQLKPSWFLSGAYSRMQQHLHRIYPLTTTSLPYAYWIPSTDSIKPQQSHQLSLSLSGKLCNDIFEFSAGAYYKHAQNKLEYLDSRVDPPPYGPALLGSDSWVRKVAAGSLMAYGMEYSVRKAKGNLRGWLSYALSWSYLTMPEVNEGKHFEYNNNRRHNLNLVGIYQLGKHLELSATFTFQSKPPARIFIEKTFAPNTYTTQGLMVSNFQLGTYHRLDISASWRMQYKGDIYAVWNLSIFNVYNRPNPLYYVNNPAANTALFPILVSASYALNF